MSTSSTTDCPPPVHGPGMAEIKPHNAAQIKGGWNQLLNRDESIPNKMLVTYEPVDASGRPRGTSWSTRAVRVRVIAFAPTQPAPGPLDARWCDLGVVNLNPDAVGRLALTLTNRRLFGMIVEPFVVKHFNKKVLAPRGRRRTARPLGAAGADVTWNEVADFYRQLARETDDRFLGELADQMVA